MSQPDPADVIRDVGNVTPLAGHRAYRPNMVSLAREQIRSARLSRNMDHKQFAVALSPLLGYEPQVALLIAWETKVDPPGSVVSAAGIIAQNGPGAGAGDGMSRLLAGQYCGVTAAYASRGEFLAEMPPPELL